MRAFIQRNPVLTFVVLTLGLQGSIVLAVWAGLEPGERLHGDPGLHNLFRLRVFVPLAMAMLITVALEGRHGLRNLFIGYTRWKVPARWYLLAISWKFLLAWAGIGVVCALTDAAWPGWFADDFWWGYLMNLPFIIGIALVEETSWIRFCVTRMQMRYSAFWSAVIIGNAWSLWYLPMILIGEGVPPAYPIPVFHACMLSLTILLVWVYNSTHSGTVLLVMQILSNTVFMMVDVLPGGEFKADGTLEVRYVIGYSYVFMAAAAALVVLFGTRNLTGGQRVRWDDHAHGPEKAGERTEDKSLSAAA